MTRLHIAAAIRRVVIERAISRCEYCLLPAEWVGTPRHIDHIIPLKHGGTSAEDNLAYACFDCNIAKGSDIAAFDPQIGTMTRLFHPRIDVWSTHFQLDDGALVGISMLGRAKSIYSGSMKHRACANAGCSLRRKSIRSRILAQRSAFSPLPPAPTLYLIKSCGYNSRTGAYRLLVTVGRVE